MKNETSEEASKRVVNNSSLITAENSSTLQSKLHQRRNKLAAIKEKKYSNTALFENQKRDWSKKDKKKPKGGLYITAVTLSRFRETDLETKSTLQTTTNYSKNKNSRNTFLKKKSSLPYINKYSKNIGGHFFEYFENMGKNENINKDIEPKKEGSKKKLKDNKNKTFRDDKNEYIRKTNEIKRLKYELDLKKNAMEDYKVSLKNQLNSFNYTITNIKEYKDDLENNFISKYNENLRNLSRKIFNDKLLLDNQNNQLKRLKNEVTNLKQMIIKKENTILDIEKWLKLQIYIKEGKDPENLKMALEKYKGKLIFNSMDELENNLAYKENQNIWLIDKYNKSEREKENLTPWLFDQKKSYASFEKNFTSNIADKLAVLNSLKKQERDLKLTITQLKNLYEKNTEEPKPTPLLKTSNTFYNKELLETQMKINELGIKYKPIKEKNNIYDHIDCIFYLFLSNDITGISLDLATNNQLSNINLPKFKRAIIQMNFIEISLNYLMADINKKKKEKNGKQIMEKTSKIIDAYHKMINVNRNKKEMKKKRDNILKKVQNRANKNYVFSRGKTDYNVVLVDKNREMERIKNKKYIKNEDIWDFLHDV